MATENVIVAMVKAGGDRQVTNCLEQQILFYLMITFNF